MINDQERFRILKAAYDLSVRMERPLGGDELLQFYSVTTGDTVEQPKWVQSLKELEVLGDLKAKFFKDSEGTPRVQMIQITQGGTKFVQQQANITTPSSPTDKKSWLTTNKRWAIGLGVTFCIAILQIMSQRGKRIHGVAPRAEVGGDISAGRDVWIVGNADSISSVETAKGPPSNELIASIEFEHASPFVSREVYGENQINVYYYKVRIRNESDNSTIRVARLELTDLQRLDANEGVFKPWEDIEPVQLEWGSSMPKEIPPRGKVLVPFARIFPPELQKITDEKLSGDRDIPHLRFTVLPGTWPRKMTSHVPPGTHRFKLTVYFEKEPPAEIALELAWPGKQRESIGSMAQEIKIRKLE